MGGSIMATRTFTSAGTNNLWSNPANWDGGVTIPADGDSVTIPSGQTCEYDYNSAYTTGIAGITVTGTLSLTRTAGTYKLFMKAGTYIGGTELLIVALQTLLFPLFSLIDPLYRQFHHKPIIHFSDSGHC